jgi:hypothetical protein
MKEQHKWKMGIDYEASWLRGNQLLRRHEWFPFWPLGQWLFYYHHKAQIMQRSLAHIHCGSSGM